VHVKYVDKWTFYVDLRKGSQKITIVNIYCQFALPRYIFVQRIEDILNGFYNADFMGDLNAKSPIWHGPGTDQHGEKIKDLIEQHNSRQQRRKTFNLQEQGHWKEI